MYLQIFVLIFLINLSNVAAKENDTSDAKKSDSRTIYDQRQTGKYNVHVNIKDVQFFSLSDSISSLGDYGSYDYGEYGQVDGDGDYDISHLTVNPIFAFLGTQSKPTKPSTTTQPTTEKVDFSSSTLVSQELSSSANKETTTMKQEIQTTVKQENISNTFLSSTTAKPALGPLKLNESIDYEEIPVEVQYYRANHPKLPLAYASLLQNHNRHAINLKRHRQPSVVQILDGRRNNNVKIVESGDDQERTVKICGRGEFRDSNGRCRIKVNGRKHVRGLRRVFNALSSILPKSK
ncbi:hypothetical protein ACKWTF_002197 [Chironomus riparius]